ncbi:gliding motility-associated C-terminal domain-containing protein, partial [Spirosoma sp.]|uniref:gliding motility-associated C-terminal domain-containing protein n=1 Tax=Spirosoma sp. TaxID=1899569 RepID=UPI003B3A84CE
MMNLLPITCFLKLWLADDRVKSGTATRCLLIGLFFFCTQSIPLLAQTIDPNNNYCTNALGAAEGGFTLDKTRICPGERIRVTSFKPGLASISYIADYKGNGIPTANLQPGVFTYNTPGTYTILQRATLNGVLAVKCQTVTVLPLDPVQFSAKSCTGKQVTLQVNTATLGQYDTYLLNWNDGTPPIEMTRSALEAGPQHTYDDAAPNVVTITLDGIYGALNLPLCTSTFQQAVALASDISQPTIQVLDAPDNGTITLQYEVGPASPVQLYQKINGTYVTTNQRAVGPGAFTVKTDATQAQCFKVVSQDVCGSTTLDSKEVCSLVLDAKATNKKNTLNWQAYTNLPAGSTFQNYQIILNDAPQGNAINSQNTTTYTDTSVTCGTPYCYRIVATVGDGATQTTITSAPACVTGINGTVPDNLGNVVVSVENNRPTVMTHLPVAGRPSSYTLSISRADGGSGTFSPVATLENDSTFTDNGADASAQSYCYKVEYQGGCGLGLPVSEPVCSIHLSSSSIRSMDWNAESPFLPGSVSDYVVELIDSVRTRERSNGVATHYERSPSEVVYLYRVAA